MPDLLVMYHVIVFLFYFVSDVMLILVVLLQNLEYHHDLVLVDMIINHV